MHIRASSEEQVHQLVASGIVVFRDIAEGADAQWVVAGDGRAVFAR